MNAAPGVLEEAQRLQPLLAAQGDAIEAARRIPPEVNAELAAAGFYRMFLPTALGGLETSPVLALEVFETLAQGDAACAWVSFIGATSGTALARIPDQAARAMFTRPDSLIAGVFAPMGKAVQADGGFVVNGRWQWGSGTENADWILGGCMLHGPDGPLLTDSGAPRQHMLLFPRDAVEFLDTWHVSGLRGTGSTDFQVTDVFVPSAHVVGLEVRENPPQPLFQFPNFTLLAIGIAGVALGIARAAIDDLVALAASKRRAGSRSTIADRSQSQVEVAQAEATLRSARAFLYATLEAAWALAQRGEPVPVEARRDVRLATTWAVQSAVKVVDAMYTLAGGAAVYETSRLQRHFRDVHVATQHIMVGPQTLETAGRLFLGVEANTAML